MRQYDVCRLKDGRDNLVVVLQHEAADDLSTRIVAPFSEKPFRQLIARARVPVEFDNRQFVLQLDRLAAIDRRSIGDVVGRVADFEYQIKNGLDLLLFGV